MSTTHEYPTKDYWQGGWAVGARARKCGSHINGFLSIQRSRSQCHSVRRTVSAADIASSSSSSSVSAINVLHRRVRGLVSQVYKTNSRISSISYVRRRHHNVKGGTWRCITDSTATYTSSKREKNMTTDTRHMRHISKQHVGQDTVGRNPPCTQYTKRVGYLRTPHGEV